MNTVTVVAVVVAYNRCELVLESLSALQAQTRVPDVVLVIDNASTDETAAAVSSVPGVVLRTLSRNTGGAGGFAAGIAAAVSSFGADWVWAMDDDTVPEPTALEELLRAVEAAPRDTDVLGSRVVWTDGDDHPMNTPRPNPFASKGRLASAQSMGLTDVRSSSFVSMFIRADAVRRRGLPVADYFIWNDDFEYSARLIRGRRGAVAPLSVVVHKTRVKGSTDADPGARFYNEVRNKTWMMRISAALSLPEKLVYGGATVRRWIRTFVRSENRAVLRDGLRRGLRDGLLQRPRRNAEVLADLGETTRDVEAIENGSDK